MLCWDFWIHCNICLLPATDHNIFHVKLFIYVSGFLYRDAIKNWYLIHYCNISYGITNI